MRLDDRAHKFSIVLTKLTQTTVLYLAVYRAPVTYELNNRLAYHSKVRMSNVRFLGEENIFISSAPVKKENEKHLCLVLLTDTIPFNPLNPRRSFFLLSSL